MVEYATSEDVDKMGSSEEAARDVLTALKNMKNDAANRARPVEQMLDEMIANIEEIESGNSHLSPSDLNEFKSTLSALAVIGDDARQAARDIDILQEAMRMESNPEKEKQEDVEKFAANSVEELRDYIVQPMEESLREGSLSEQEIREAYEAAGEQFFRL